MKKLRRACEGLFFKPYVLLLGKKTPNLLSNLFIGIVITLFNFSLKMVPFDPLSSQGITNLNLR